MAEHDGLHEIQRHYPCKVAIEAVISGQAIKWSRELRGKGRRTTWATLATLRPIVEQWQLDDAQRQTLPVIAVYPCDRLERTVFGPETGAVEIGDADDEGFGVGGGSGSGFGAGSGWGDGSGSGSGSGDGAGSGAGSGSGAGHGDGSGSGARPHQLRPSWRTGVEDVRAVQERFDAYDGAFWSNDRLTDLVGWIRIQTVADLRRNEPLPHLKAVLAAIGACLPGVAQAWYDVPQETLLLQFRDGSVKPFEVLSDGYIAMLGIIADIALRCVLLNRHLGEAALQTTPGVVVIDEIDLHLHPRWQRQVVDDLRRVFPCIHFVVTTHSPQVLASVRPEWVRVMGAGPAPEHVAHTLGRDSNALLEDVMEVTSRPAAVQDQIRELFASVDDERYPDARRLLEELERDLGPDDGDLVRARWMLDVEDGHAAVLQGD